ncbi:hypothetical protein [Lactobacillus sp. PV034]|uniref:hypothetical protein n=1 Tax=Lactobacillus sp. PV034 TaxID=2594495 RepID=UPI002240945C|nr:hypothetical protein [Lactobacillus sp. PV034]QNQ81012.1 hypothetical protein FP432_05320 [Lactobacillus sp. PV034]
MKKSRLWAGLVALLLVFVTTGCANNASKTSSADYNTLMSQGKDYVDDQNYSKAEDKFEQAHQIKATKESKAYADQAEDMNDAKDSISDYEFGAALKDLNKAQTKNNGYAVMTKQAKKLYNTIDEVNNNIKNEINPLYRKAKNAYKNNDYSETEELCNQILDLPYLNGKYAKYYKQIKSDVKDLLNDAQDAAGDSDSSSSKKSNSNNSSEDTNSNEDAQTSSKNSSSSNQASSSNNGNSMTVGGQAVTARVIAQVREKLGSIGVNTSSWTDQDVANFMNSAAQNGHTTIDSYTQSDANNFTK